MQELTYYFKVLCPYCESRLPVRYNGATVCSGIFLKCKDKNCRREFELIINHGRQVIPRP